MHLIQRQYNRILWPHPTCIITTTVHARSTAHRTDFLTQLPYFCQRPVRKEQLTAVANLSMLAGRLIQIHYSTLHVVVHTPATSVSFHVPLSRNRLIIYLVYGRQLLNTFSASHNKQIIEENSKHSLYARTSRVLRTPQRFRQMSILFFSLLVEIIKF
jgi:hypothetical protein